MATVRDIAIIVVAVESILILAALIILILQVIGLVRFLREEIKPLITSAQETVGTVQGTANFMSDNLVTPVVEISSRVAGARQMLRAIRETVGGRPSRRKR